MITKEQFNALFANVRSPQQCGLKLVASEEDDDSTELIQIYESGGIFFRFEYKVDNYGDSNDVLRSIRIVQPTTKTVEAYE